MDWLKPRAIAAAPIVSAVIGVVVLLWAAMLLIDSRGFGYDFAAYDGAARRIVDGLPLYFADTAERYRQQLYEGLYLYPPPLAIALIPLTVLSLHDATVAWMVFRIGLLVVGCWVLPVSRSARLLTFAVACISLPALFDLNLGNVSIVVFALSALAWRTTDRPIGALAHAALIAIRFPFAVFFLGWLIERRFRMIAWTIVAGLALLLISLPIVGLTTYMDYVTILRGLPDISTGPHNLSLKSTVLALGLPTALGAAAVLAGYVIGVVAVVYSARRRDADIGFAICVTATLLLTPFIHPHYLVVLLVPTALLVHRGYYLALVIPLLGWLPDPVLPLLAPLTIGVLLIARRDEAGSR